MENKEFHQRAIDLTGQNRESATKALWQEPKLTFVEPKLTEHGELTEVTGQFFGGFSTTF